MKVASVLESWEPSGHTGTFPSRAESSWDSLEFLGVCSLLWAGRAVINTLSSGIFLPSGLVLHPGNSLPHSPLALKGCERMDGHLFPSLHGPAGAKGTETPRQPLEASFQVCFPGSPANGLAEHPGCDSRVRCHSPALREQLQCLSAALARSDLLCTPCISIWHLLSPCVLCLPNYWGKLPEGEDTMFQTSPRTEQLLAWLFCKMICVSMGHDKNAVLGALGASSHRVLWQEQAQMWLRQSRCWTGRSGGQGRAATAATDTET